MTPAYVLQISSFRPAVLPVSRRTRVTDVPTDAKLRGMIQFAFACYGGGCPQTDNFDRLNKSPKKIADKPFLSRLPQKLLAHPNGGALACVPMLKGHGPTLFKATRAVHSPRGFGTSLHGCYRGNESGNVPYRLNADFGTTRYN